MTTRRRVLALAAAVLGGLALGCETAPNRGRLIIAGGAISADNALIYPRFIASLPPDAPIGIIPTASANPAEGLASSVRTVSRHAASRPIEPILLPVDQPALASNGRVVEQIRRCRALWFTGGVQSRIVTFFRPASGDTPAYRAVKDVLARGGVIGGTSAGAAMMSDPMIVGGTSEQALQGNSRGAGDDEGFGIGKGMGLFPFGLTDQHFLRRGRLGRLVVALELAGLPRGFGVDEDSALDVDLSTGQITCLGRAMVVDVSSMARAGGARTGVRISLVQTRDLIDARTGSVTTIRPRLTPRTPPAPQIGDASPVPAAWSATGVLTALERLAPDPGTSVELRSDSFVVRYRARIETTFHGSFDALTVIDAEMDILPAGPAPGT